MKNFILFIALFFSFSATAQNFQIGETPAPAGDTVFIQNSGGGTVFPLMLDPDLFFRVEAPTYYFGGATFSNDNINEWKIAFGWGDHSLAGYLSSESDPTVPSFIKSITNTEKTNWNTVYSAMTTFTTASNTQTFTNKSGNISLWTNDAGFITLSNSGTFTNKGGLISMWTNDVGYLTTENDGNSSNEIQNLGGTGRRITLTSGGSYTIPLTPWDSILTKPTTLSGFGITDPVVLTSGSYSNPSWLTSVAKSKITFTGSSANYVAADGSEIPFPDIDVIPIGTVISGIWASAPDGYLLLRGGTIGDASSGATVFANALMQDLFQLLWSSFADSEASVSGGRGASASADWAAHKTIQLPDIRGRFVLGKATSGTGTTLGGLGGQLDMVYSIDPPNTSSASAGSHSHTGTTTAPSAASGLLAIGSGFASATHTHTFTTSNDGSHTHDTNISSFNTSANTPAFISLNYAIKY